MSLFCFHCQETAKNQGWTVMGMCGKKDDTANLQDLLIYVLKGISIFSEKLDNTGAGFFTTKALFSTITNANFDSEKITDFVKEGLRIKQQLKETYTKQENPLTGLHDAALWYATDEGEFLKKAADVGVLSTENEDVRSLRELLIYGLKGLAAYAHHAAVLGKEKDEIYKFIFAALASTTRDLSTEEMIGMVMKAGETAVITMALLDEANTSAYGHPEITEVNIGVRNNPGILVSGHDLKDLEDLLLQTEGTGIDVYTHSEMLPANYYPKLKKFNHLVGNYGNAWWKQSTEFESHFDDHQLYYPLERFL